MDLLKRWRRKRDNPPTHEDNQLLLGQVLWRLGEELRSVKKRSEEVNRTAIVNVTKAKATLQVGITKEGSGEINFTVFDIGAKGAAAIAKEAITTLEVELDVEGIEYQ